MAADEGTTGGDKGGLRNLIGAMQALADRAARTIRAVQPVIDQRSAQAQRALVPVRRWLEINGPRVAEVMVALQKFSAEAHVENWADLDEDEWIEALDLMRTDDGLPLAWLPPGHVVKALLAAADHGARDAVLLAHADEIAADARRILDDVTHQKVAALHAAVIAAWDAWDADLTVPAQATAAAAIGEILQLQGFEEFAAFRTKWEPHRGAHPEEWHLTAFRVTAVMCALSTAVQREDQGKFPGFNRHATLHRLDSVQYTRANALRALMLVSAATRELQFSVAAEWTTSTRFTPPQLRAAPPPEPSGDPDVGRSETAKPPTDQRDDRDR